MERATQPKLGASLAQKIWYFCERVGGIEPPSPDWQPGVIATIRYPRIFVILVYQKYFIKQSLFDYMRRGWDSNPHIAALQAAA